MFKRILLIGGVLLVASALLLQPVLALATPTPAPTVTDQEEQRNQDLIKELSLKLPKTTDDPNLAITFIPPNKKEDVSIQVDDQTYAKAKSPFVLPTLSIGQHVITIKYKNKDGVLRVLTSNLVVMPKAPEFATSLPTAGQVDETVTLSGTAIPSANISIVQNSQQILTTTTDENGSWSVESQGLISGRNNFVAMAIKNGFASNFSKSYSITAGSRPIVTTVVNNQKTLLTQIKESGQQAWRWVQRHQQESILAVLAIAGVVVVYVIIRWLRTRKAASEEKTIADILQNRRSVNDTMSITARLKQNPNMAIPPQKETKKEKAALKTTAKKTAPVKPAPKAKPAKANKKETLPPAKAEPALESPIETTENPLEQADRLLANEPATKPVAPAKGKGKLSKEEFLKRFKKA